MDKKMKRIFFREKGRVYFNKNTERKILFFMTLFMLALGVVAEMGLW